MNSEINWSNLVRNGRAKAVGISWSKEELEALKNGMTPSQVRQGILSKEDLEDEDPDDLTGKSLEELKEIADELGIEYTHQVGMSDLIVEINKVQKAIEDTPLEDLKRSQLMKKLSNMGGKVDFSMTKKQLIAKIKEIEE